MQQANLRLPEDSLLAPDFNAQIVALLNTHTNLDDDWDLLEQAHALAEKEEFAKARRLVRQVLRHDPSNKTATLFLLEIEEDLIKHLRHLNQIEKHWHSELSKKKLLRPYLHRDPWIDERTKPYLELLANKAGTLVDLGRYNDALGTINQILKLDPLDHVHMHRLAIPISIFLEYFTHAQMLITRYAAQGINTHIILATSILTYKMGDYKQCAKLVMSLNNANMYLISHLLTNHFETPATSTYKPGSEDEALDVLTDFVFVIQSIPGFIHFVADTLASQNETGRCTYAQLKH